MKVLAFDTSTEYLSLALLNDSDILQRDLKPGTGHAALLFCEIDKLLAQAGITIAEVELLGVGCGPGSFTGVRVGVSAAQAIAYAQSIPVFGVSSLATMAAQASTERALAVVDARMKEVYAGCYRVLNGKPSPDGAETVQAVRDLKFPDGTSGASDWTGQEWSVVALGWGAFGDELIKAFASTPPTEIVKDAHPDARLIAMIAQDQQRAGDSGECLNLVPSYVRNEVAKVATKA